MSSTNKTTHYELPSFVGSDKPAWLVDWNGAMSTIDAAIYEAKTTADSALSASTTNAADIATLQSTVLGQTTDLNTLTTALNTLTGTVNTITSLIGNGEPTTTDKTIIGAINEINEKIPGDPSAAISQLQNLTTLKNKKIAIVGDSLSVAGTWADDFADALDGIATVDNKSVTAKAMGWLHTDGWSTILGSNDYDIVIIALGTNDWGGATPFGVFSDTPSGSTFNDALINGYKDLLAYYPNNKIPEVYYITPFSHTPANPYNSFKATLDVYRKCIANFAKVVGARFINGDCIPIISAGLSNKAKSIYMDANGTHFTSAYNSILADYILSKILSGGDAAVSETDGIEIDLSSYFGSNVDSNSTKIFTLTVSGNTVHCHIVAKVNSPFSAAHTEIADLPANISKLLHTRPSGVVSTLLPIGVYGLGGDANVAACIDIQGTKVSVNAGAYSGTGMNIEADWYINTPYLFAKSFNVQS